MIICFGVYSCSKLFTYTVTDSIEHNNAYFVEGLTFHSDGLFLESVGLRGKSKIVLYDKLGTELASHTLSSAEFAEGVSFFDPDISMFSTDIKLKTLKYIAQLTYKKGLLHFYALHSNIDSDLHQFEYLGKANLPKGIKEGWGLTTTVDKKQLIVGDGSSSLYFLKVSLENNEILAKIVNTVTIHDCKSQMKAIKGSNELETVPANIISAGYDNISPLCSFQPPAKQHVWTNIIGTWCIAVVDLEADAEVVAWIDLTDIDPSFSKFDRVANGIAFSYTDNSIWVTGKRWSKSYKIELLELDPTSFSPKQKCKTPWSTVKSDFKKETNCT